ncbi:MAG: tellurite resistance TerB family protein [Roseibium sp.]|uniref:tellurite resistance TerB family protein n=1 Tax=Alphaproteobacteria TaxID=28211 RepID=UPI00329694C7
MPLAWLKENTAKARASLTAEVSKYKNKQFMEAVIAGCALMAAADGNVSADEKKKMMGYIQQSEELKHFDQGEMMASFQKIVTGFEFDMDLGKAEALKVIGRLKGKDEQARILVRVVCAIGASDGDFDADEQALASQISRELGLDPKDFDLA